MIRAIKKFFGIGSDFRSGIKIVVNKEKLETRVALVENGMLEEYTIERSDSDNVVGSIFKGKVRNLEPGLKAMFVDLGFEKNAFLHYWDAIPAALDEELEAIERGGKSSRKPKITSKDIPTIYPVGSEVMVQVTKGPIGNKGPRVTTNISLAGRYMVLMPRNDQFGISKKIEEPKERLRLRRIMERLSVPEGMGIILRTAALGMKARYFVRDLAMLVEQWQKVEENNASMKSPARVFNEPTSSNAPSATSSPRKSMKSSATTKPPPNACAPSPARSADARNAASASTPADNQSSTTSAYKNKSITPSSAKSGSHAAATSSSTKPRP